jgi:hypothetical protein
MHQYKEGSFLEGVFMACCGQERTLQMPFLQQLFLLPSVPNNQYTGLSHLGWCSLNPLTHQRSLSCLTCSYLQGVWIRL